MILHNRSVISISVVLFYFLAVCVADKSSTVRSVTSTSTEVANHTTILQGSTSNVSNCSCGKHSYNCFINFSKKICGCFLGYKQTNDTVYGECEKCDCGEKSISCEFVSGLKKCSCSSGYLDAAGTCTLCNCGPYSTSCAFPFERMKKCTCMKGYVAYGKLGIIGDDTCKECNCGPNSVSCKYEYGIVKKCTCKQGYIPEGTNILEGDDRCNGCDCGVNSLSCEIDFLGSKRCTCRAGYVAEGGTCKNSYPDCDCGLNSISCSRSYDGYRRCICRIGYYAKRFSWTSHEDCVPNGKNNNNTSMWRTGTFIISGIYAVIIIALLIKIVYKKIQMSSI